MTAPISDVVTVAIDSLGLDDAAVRSLIKSYRLAATQYRLMDAVGRNRQAAANHLEILKELELFSGRAALDLMEIPPEYGDQLAMTISRYARLDRDVPLTDLFLAISKGIHDILEDIQPPRGRPANLALKLAIVELLPALETTTGHVARIRWNKAKGTAPESASVVTDTLVTMLKSIDERIWDVSIFNMIEKVRAMAAKS